VVYLLSYMHGLGVTNMVYPGAVHSRFEHSLGVYWLAGETVQRLKTFQVFGYFVQISVVRTVTFL